MKMRGIAAAAAALLLLLTSCSENGDISGITEETSMIENADTTAEVTDGYTHVGNLAYKASGEEKYENDQYQFRKDFVLETEYSGETFNRWTLTYDSSVPLRGTIKYKCGAGKFKTESEDKFFLEAGKGKTFSAVLRLFFDNVQADSVEYITLETVEGNKTKFALLGFETETLKVPKGGTYYLENDRYKLGVLLSWGGGISYIEDKNDGDASLGNLINRCDTGRLIQQSYYGVGNGEYYSSAKYNDTVWNYNPVQGGDQHGNASKIVDYLPSEDGKSIYIKTQPMDWAQNGSPCPAYMENTYTLYDDGIAVDNRFTDFFGVLHPAAHQELPAFYVVSYLGVFNYYGGIRPWTGDKYTSLPDEPFWAGEQKCYHSISPLNTETWAAWTNTDGYGIGLYVPGTEIMLAGRFGYNGSKSPADGATNYVAPLRTMNIVSFKPFTYSYFITTGTVDEMRATFEKHK